MAIKGAPSNTGIGAPVANVESAKAKADAVALANETMALVSNSWPIGSVFISVVATDPASLLGIGTWSAIAAGRVLVGIDSGDTDFDTVEETGGAKTKAISAHAGTAVADHASHTHDGASTLATPDLVAADATATGVSIRTGGPDATMTHNVTQPSAHTDLSVVQPYFVVYMWKRTA